MLLQPNPTTKQPLTLYHNQTTITNPVSYSIGFSQNSIFHHKQPLFSKTHKQDSVFIAFSSISQVHSYGTVDFERRPFPKWNEIHKKISMLDLDAASVLNDLEKDGKIISKWELCRVVKELRKFRRYKLALQVYEWMNNMPKRYRTTTSDTAIQLDLISKVHGIPSAEQYFLKLPDALKDKRIYGSLLNAYARAKMQEEAESLMEEMRSKNYATHSLPFNVMMSFYMSLKDHDKIESLVAEMKEKKIRLDTYSYNIWLSSYGYHGSPEKMEQVFEQMQMDRMINPNWSTFSTMANVYTKFKQFEKADDCLKKLENIVTGRDRMPYHYLISIYATLGKKEEIYRIWTLYKEKFVNILNLGYHTIIAALVRVNDVEGAEKMYTEWLSVASLYDARVGNLLLGSYVRNRHSVKVAAFFDQMTKWGGKPNPITWEILAEYHMNNKKISEAMSCLRNAASAEGAKSWRPKPSNVTSFLQVFEQEGDVASKDAFIEIMKQVGCLNDPCYMSSIPICGGGTSTRDASAVDGRPNGEEEHALVDELEEIL